MEFGRRGAVVRGARVARGAVAGGGGGLARRVLAPLVPVEVEVAAVAAVEVFIALLAEVVEGGAGWEEAPGDGPARF